MFLPTFMASKHPDSHIFQQTRTIFIHIQNIIQTHILTKKSAPLPGGHVFQATGAIFELVQDIIGTNLLTKFNDDRTINMAHTVLTMLYYSFIKKNVTPLWRPCFSPTETIFELIQDIIGANRLTKFHDDRTINVASRVLIRKNAPLPGGNVFKETETIFKCIQDIIGTNILTKFHEDRKINVDSRVFIRKNAPPPGGHVFQANVTIFELIQYITETNLLIKFHGDWTIHVASRPYISIYEKNALPPDIIGTNLLTTFFEDRKINLASIVFTRKNAPLLGMNLLTKFHEDWTINVASRVLTMKNAPPLGSHVFQANVTIFKLIQDIIETNRLTKFHEDWTINVVSRVLTRQMLTPHNTRRTRDKRRSQKLTMSTLCSVLLSDDDWGKVKTLSLEAVRRTPM
ncbi:hypothetical protein DPMN_124608 [Dreissena polymorpha]|uniref:Uncharacterized protein n=1 Tax=Dreissena polymorpha TaxID=45954 RepID=A0A9D4JWD1_DREPO|nr:hypothetical protein DPMN_124608 [Dreissena polymorpha]